MSVSIRQRQYNVMYCKLVSDKYNVIGCIVSYALFFTGPRSCYDHNFLINLEISARSSQKNMGESQCDQQTLWYDHEERRQPGSVLNMLKAITARVLKYDIVVNCRSIAVGFETAYKEHYEIAGWVNSKKNKCNIIWCIVS